jgi:hypothetical protein
MNDSHDRELRRVVFSEAADMSWWQRQSDKAAKGGT